MHRLMHDHVAFTSSNQPSIADHAPNPPSLPPITFLPTTNSSSRLEHHHRVYPQQQQQHQLPPHHRLQDLRPVFQVPSSPDHLQQPIHHQAGPRHNPRPPQHHSHLPPQHSQPLQQSILLNTSPIYPMNPPIPMYSLPPSNAPHQSPSTSRHLPPYRSPSFSHNTLFNDPTPTYNTSTYAHRYQYQAPQ